MGLIADTLRSTLAELAAADARLYRGLAAELATPSALPAAADDDTADEVVADVVTAFQAVRDAMTEARFLKVFEQTPEMVRLWDALMELEDVTKE